MIMANKGENKKLKAVASPRTMYVNRKNKVWAVRSKAGPHSRATSVPIALALRELLGYAQNLREARIMLTKRKVLVDGVVRTSKAFPVGLFDVIDLPEMKERHRVLFDSKGRVRLAKIDAKEALTKVCKVVGKTAAKKGRVQLRLHDGKSIRLDKTKLKVGDSVKISLPDNKILEELPLEKGQLVYMLTGKHVDKRAKIIEIFPGTINRTRSVALQEEKNKYQTTEKSLIVVGKDKPLVELEAKAEK